MFFMLIIKNILESFSVLQCPSGVIWLGLHPSAQVVRCKQGNEYDSSWFVFVILTGKQRQIPYLDGLDRNSIYQRRM